MIDNVVQLVCSGLAYAKLINIDINPVLCSPLTLRLRVFQIHRIRRIQREPVHVKYMCTYACTPVPLLCTYSSLRHLDATLFSRRPALSIEYKIQYLKSVMVTSKFPPCHVHRNTVYMQVIIPTSATLFSTEAVFAPRCLNNAILTALGRLYAAGFIIRILRYLSSEAIRQIPYISKLTEQQTKIYI